MPESYSFERFLPHIQPPEVSLFVTYRLAGSLPIAVWNALVEQFPNQAVHWEDEKSTRNFFRAYDSYLDTNPNGPYWLKEPAIANIVMDSLHFLNGKHLHLWAYCIMPNHVHLLAHTFEPGLMLHEIMRNHKTFSGREANLVLGNTGKPFWAREYYDHMVRSDRSFFNILKYIAENPVKAKLVKHWEDWPYTYVAPSSGILPG